MKIVQLVIQNFKGIKAVTITPEGNVVTLSGKNGSGKTSGIDSIAAVLGGDKLCPAKPIRDGETEGFVSATLDDWPEFGLVTAERTFKLKDGEVTSSLKLFRKSDGLKLDKPQTRLSELIDNVGFSPWEFMTLDADKQFATLQKLVGIDFKLLDLKRKQVFEERTGVNRDLEAAKARLAKMPPGSNAPAVSVADLLKEQDQLLADQKKHEAFKARYDNAVRDWEDAKSKLAGAKTRVEELEQALEKAKAQVVVEAAIEAKAVATGKRCKADLAEFKAPDLTEIRKKLAEAEATNESARAFKVREEEAAKVAETEKASKAITKQLDEIDAQKTAAIEAAKFPIEGLGFGDGTVTFKGSQGVIPLSEVNEAEQLRISVAIGASVHKRLKVMLIKKGNDLDSDSLKRLGEYAKAHGLQVWLERIHAEADSDSIVFQDGQVAA